MIYISLLIFDREEGHIVLQRMILWQSISSVVVGNGCGSAPLQSFFQPWPLQNLTQSSKHHNQPSVGLVPTYLLAPRLLQVVFGPLFLATFLSRSFSPFATSFGAVVPPIFPPFLHCPYCYEGSLSPSSSKPLARWSLAPFAFAIFLSRSSPLPPPLVRHGPLSYSIPVVDVLWTPPPLSSSF